MLLKGILEIKMEVYWEYTSRNRVVNVLYTHQRWYSVFVGIAPAAQPQYG